MSEYSEAAKAAYPTPEGRSDAQRTDDLRAAFDSGVASRPALVADSREAVIDGLRAAMLGSEDGDFIDPDSEIPAGEMFRLASEYLSGVVTLAGEHAAQPMVTTLEDLDALPVGAVIRTSGAGNYSPRVAVKSHDKRGPDAYYKQPFGLWEVAEWEDGQARSDELDDLPAMVLFDPRAAGFRAAPTCPSCGSEHPKFHNVDGTRTCPDAYHRAAPTTETGNAGQ